MFFLELEDKNKTVTINYSYTLNDTDFYDIIEEQFNQKIKEYLTIEDIDMRIEEVTLKLNEKLDDINTSPTIIEKEPETTLEETKENNRHKEQLACIKSESCIIQEKEEAAVPVASAPPVTGAATVAVNAKPLKYNFFKSGNFVFLLVGGFVLIGFYLKVAKPYMKKLQQPAQTQNKFSDENRKKMLELQQLEDKEKEINQREAALKKAEEAEQKEEAKADADFEKKREEEKPNVKIENSPPDG